MEDIARNIYLDLGLSLQYLDKIVQERHYYHTLSFVLYNPRDYGIEPFIVSRYLLIKKYQVHFSNSYSSDKNKKYISIDFWMGTQFTYEPTTT